MMLISKRSRKRSDLFESRFRNGQVGDFPLRQYLRCREDFGTGILHAVLIVVFIITLLGFSRTLGHLFDSHGADLKPWYKWGTLSLMGLFVLSVLRRLYYKLLELKEIRMAMVHYKTAYQDQDEELVEE